MDGFLSGLGVSDVSKLLAELAIHGIQEPTDLVAMDDADKLELVHLLKTGGICLGDRGKIKRVTAASTSTSTDVQTRTAPMTSAPIALKSVKLAVPQHFDVDKFNHMEETLLEMVNNKLKADALWKNIDFNGNGVVSMAEIDKFLKNYYPLLSNKKAVMRAHKRTLKVDGDGDDWIQREEIVFLMINLFYYNKILGIFEEIDTSGDGLVDFDEFVAGLDILGFGITRDEAWHEFCKMDDDRSGHVMFQEFCDYVAAKQWPGGFEAYYECQTQMGESARKRKTGRRLHGSVAGSKTPDTMPDVHTTKYDALEMKILSVVSTKKLAKALYNEIDTKKTGKISKKRFTTWVQNHYPELNEKEAIAYAFRKTNEDGDGDNFIQRDEFKDFFIQLFYFVKLKYVFTKIDKNGNGKVSFAEFTKSLVWVGLALTIEDARKEFDKMDSAGGGDGEVDFAEFCDWISANKIPVD